jgi:hypothetical protein
VDVGQLPSRLPRSQTQESVNQSVSSISQSVSQSSSNLCMFTETARLLQRA